MRRRRRVPGEKWLAVGAIAVDVLNEALRVDAGGVEILADADDLGVVPILGIRPVPAARSEVRSAVHGRKSPLEATPDRTRRDLTVAEMPLAGHVGVIAGILEQLRQTHDVEIQDAFVTRRASLGAFIDSIHDAEAGNMRIGARHQHRPCRRAGHVGVELRQQHAAGGETIDIRRRNFAAENAEIGPAEVVGEDEHEVRAALGCIRYCSRID
jgi:hypothetical protein